jgi:Tol biopolymer transport system component
MPGVRRIAGVAALVLALGACSWIGRADVDSNEVAHQNTGADGTVAISSDGRYVSFVTNGPLDPADDDNAPSLYRRDIASGTTKLLTTTDPEVGQGLLENVSMSNDGGRVAFSTLDGMTADDTNDNYDVYVVDATTKALTRVSVDSQGDDLADVSDIPQFLLSGDGNVVVMRVVDGNGDSHVYVHDLGAGTTTELGEAAGRELTDLSDDGSTLVSADGGLLTFFDTVNDSSDFLECSSDGAAITGDGRIVVADFFGEEGCPDGVNRYDRGTGTFFDSGVGHATVSAGGVSADGEYFVYVPTDPFPPHGLKPGQAYVHGFTFAIDQLLSGDAAGQSVSGSGDRPVLSDDASTTAFAVSASFPDLTPPGPAVMVRPGLRPLAWATSPGSVARGAQHVTTTVIGVGMVAATIDLGPGITVHSATPTLNGYVQVDLSVAADAAPGPRDVRVTNHSPGGEAVETCSGCLTVT